MKCEELKKKLSLFMDHELNDKDRKIVEAHLLQCSACQKEVKRLESLNRIGKAEIFDEPGSEYWEELTGNIMNKIHPAEKKQPHWRDILDKLGSVVLPEKLNYRIVGLAAATVILIFFVKISFFDQGKYNLPMEMSEIETLDEKNKYDEAEKALTEFKGRHETVEEEKIASKPTTAKLDGKQESGKETPKMIDGVRLGSGAKEENKQAIVSKAGRGTAPIKNIAKKKQFSEKKDKEMSEDEIEIVVERELAPVKSDDGDKSHRFEMAVQNQSLETSFQKRSETEHVGGVNTSKEVVQQADVAIQPPAAPVDSKLVVIASKREKTRTFKYLPTTIQADNSVSKEDAFVIILQEVNSKTNPEEKIKLLQSYLERYPETNHKNQATYLLANNLIHLAKVTKVESNIKKAVAYFQKNEILLKKFDNYKMLKKDVKKLKKKM